MLQIHSGLWLEGKNLYYFLFLLMLLKFGKQRTLSKFIAKFLKNTFLIILFSVVIALYQSNSIYSGSIGDMRTVYLVPNPYIGLSVLQRCEYLGEKNYMWVRDMAFRLNVSPVIEMEIFVPYINSRVHDAPATDRIGDILLNVNYASQSFKEYFIINWIYAFNFGSGSDFRDPSTHPMESYGHEEFRWGFLIMKNLKKWTLNFDVQYYFRTKNQKEDMFRGFDINIFGSEAWRRWFGLNPNRKKNFFYTEKLKNDNIVYKIGISQYYTYPFTIFTYLDFRHDFYNRDQFGKIEKKKAPGIFSSPLWLTVGSKYFISDETIAFQLLIKVAANKDAWDYSRIGVGLGVYTEF
jgi:hypothetical protein